MHPPEDCATSFYCSGTPFVLSLIPAAAGGSAVGYCAMHNCTVGGSNKAWSGLVAGLGVGLVLSVLGLILGSSFLARAQEDPTSVSAAGPLVVVTLEKGEKVRGALLEFRDGKVRIKPEGGAAERTLLPSEVVDLNFAPDEPVVAQTKPTGDPIAVPKANIQTKPAEKPKTNPVAEPKDGPPEWPKADPDVQPKDELKRPLWEPLAKRRQFAEDRRKKIMELVKPRIEARLTPDERNRFHELMPREPNLTPAERKELDGLRQKLGLLDPEASRRLVSEVMDEARQAQRKGGLTDYNDIHMRRLRTSMTDEERRRHIASLFAAARVSGPEAAPLFKDMAISVMRSANANPNTFEEQMKDLRAMYELFCEEVERLDAPRTR